MMANESHLLTTETTSPHSAAAMFLELVDQNLSFISGTTGHNGNGAFSLRNTTYHDFRTDPGPVVGDPSGSRGQSLQQVSCHKWQDAQHTLFQLANLCMAVSFLTPSTFRFHVLFLRCLLLVSFLLFVLWAGLFICMPDVLGWNIVFFLFDAGHIGWLMYRQLPVGLPVTHVALFNKVFKPLRVSQSEFTELCQIGAVQSLCKGGLYAVECVTPCAQRVSILLKGRSVGKRKYACLSVCLCVCRFDFLCPFIHPAII